jgi:hypothetical protein
MLCKTREQLYKANYQLNKANLYIFNLHGIAFTCV